MSRRDNPEAREQRALAKWLDAVGVLWAHVPNGGNRDKVTGANLKAEGAKAGVPDVLIFTPPPLHPNAPGVALELKAPEGAKPSDEQMAWLERLAAQGWLTAWARGFAPAVEWLQSLGYGRPQHTKPKPAVGAGCALATTGEH